MRIPDFIYPFLTQPEKNKTDHLSLPLMKTLFAALFGSIILLSCSQQNKADVNIFFDSEGFANEIIEKMEMVKPVVYKKNTINQEESEAELSDIDWSKELELLKQANINKVAFQLSYETEESALQTHYSLVSDDPLLVKKMTILKDSTGQISQIKAHLSTDNYLYASEKNLVFNFDQNMVTDYHVNGWQELFIGDRKTFEINGEVKK